MNYAYPVASSLTSCMLHGKQEHLSCLVALLEAIFYIANDTKALFTSTQNPKTFQDSPSHQIFRHMHGVLNINKNKN